MRELAGAGVAGVFTDRPDLALRDLGSGLALELEQPGVGRRQLRVHLRARRQGRARAVGMSAMRLADAPEIRTRVTGPRNVCVRTSPVIVFAPAPFAAATSTVSGRMSTSTRSPRARPRAASTVSVTPPRLDGPRGRIDDGRLEPVHRADELGDERRRRRAVHLRRRAHLLDLPPYITATWSEIESASSWSCVTYSVVIPSSSWIRRISSRSCDAHLRVERRERLVEEQHARLDRQRACERDALLHAARELMRVAGRRVRGEADELEQLVDALARGRCCRGCGSAARTRRSAPRSCSGTASTPGRPCPCRACWGRRRVMSLPSTSTRPASGRSKPATSRSAVVFPQPDGPSSERNSPCSELDVDAVQRLHRAELRWRFWSSRYGISVTPAKDGRAAPRLRPTKSRRSIGGPGDAEAEQRERGRREGLRLVRVLEEDREGVRTARGSRS